MAKKPAKLDPLDALAQGDPLRVMALMLWKARHRNPDMFVQIDERDIKGFDDCVGYLKVRPTVMIKRPPEIPAQEAIPAARNRRAISARPAIPARPYVMVTLVEEGTENVIRPVENNETDYDVAQDAAAVRKARDQAQSLADGLMRQAGSGDFSTSDVRDAANALVTMARALA